MTKPTVKDFQDVRQRAAQVRGSWTMTERRRRTGLPPDAPSKLRDFVLGCRNIDWPSSAVAASR